MSQFDKYKRGPGRKDRLVISVRKWLGMNVILCASCKWDWRGACRNPERPNATWCPEYEKRA
jgi:hypothetical protein